MTKHNPKTALRIIKSISDEVIQGESESELFTHYNEALFKCIGIVCQEEVAGIQAALLGLESRGHGPQEDGQ